MNGVPVNKTTILLWLTAALMTCEIARADFFFGRPQNLGPAVNSSAPDDHVNISSDGLTMYFQSDRPGGLGSHDIWVAMRSSVSEPWGPATNLGGPINSPAGEAFPRISPDGLTLYFSDDYWGPYRPGGHGQEADIWMTMRASPNDPWSAPVNMGSVLNSYNTDVSPFVSPDGLTLVFTSLRPGGFGTPQVTGDLWMSIRPSAEALWGPPVNLGPTVNTSFHDGEPHLLPDGLVLFFVSDRPDGFGSYDLWMTTRADRGAAWRPPVNLGASINTGSGEGSPALSADLRTLYFGSNRDGGLGDWDIYEAPILPVVDFDGDGAVDTGDLLQIIESWGGTDPSVDIGPTPFGDGIVDAADLEVLMSYWGQEMADPTLLAHWAFDETEGIVAYDSAGGNDGMILGLPQWRPEGGTVDGALELNGMTFVTADSALSPADGPFSVLAWIKGGAPGQTIISQGGGVNWLMADAPQGGLVTELSRGGRTGAGLLSQTTITDGNWHRIAFAWDGANRRLHVDGVLVAEDPQDSLAGSSGKLVIGSSKAMTPGGFWTGLIDDVRIYNRAVKP